MMTTHLHRIADALDAAQTVLPHVARLPRLKQIGLARHIDALRDGFACESAYNAALIVYDRMSKYDMTTADYADWCRSKANPWAEVEGGLAA